MIQTLLNPNHVLTDCDNITDIDGQRMASVLGKHIYGYKPGEPDMSVVKVLGLDENDDVRWSAAQSPGGTPYTGGHGIDIRNHVVSIDTDVVQEKMKPGQNVTISPDNVISATGATYSAGTNIQISQDNVISATDTKYTAGSNVQIGSDNVISATDTTYTAGDNVQISSGNVISATDTKYSAGTNIQISQDNVISATGTMYTAGDNVQISNNVISATDTKYTAGTNIQIDSNNVISGTTTFRSWTFRERTVTITEQDLTNKYVDFTYVLDGEGVAACELPNIIAMKGYNIQSSNQLNGRSLSFLLVPHGGGEAIMIASGFSIYTESVSGSYSWKAFNAIGCTMTNNVGKYDAVLRVSLDGTEPVGGTLETSGRVAVTLVGLVN